MASINVEPNGRRMIQFIAKDGKRKTIRLGKVSRRYAESVKFRVEELVAAAITGTSLNADTAGWLAKLDGPLRDKLVRVGLADSKEEEKGGPTLEEFVSAWLAGRSDYKPASRRSWRQVIDWMKRHFDPERPIADLTRDDAESFRQSMIAAGLRPTTIHKRLQHARLIFGAAMEHGHIARNPFASVRHRPGDPSERRQYVPVEDVHRVIEHCPNLTWKLMVAMARFAGLRTPSEIFSLKWSEIDWERGRVVVPQPKLEHLPGRSHRVIPLFPEIRPWLEKAFDAAPEGAVYVVPEEYRRRAQGPDGWSNANLRTTLQKIIRRAGVEPWTRLWHSMRASCETDLARRFPLAVVAKWLGNTQAVAMRHYVDVTDADFERAIQTPEEALQNPMQQAHATERTATQQMSTSQRKTPRNRVCSISTDDHAALLGRAVCRVSVVCSRCCVRSSRCMSKAIRPLIFV